MRISDSVNARNNSGSISLLNNISLSTVERLWIVLSRFFLIALIAHVLGPEGQGVYTLAITTVVVITLPVCGFEVGNNYLGNRYRSEIRALFGNALILSCIIATIVGAWLWITFGMLHENLLAALPMSYRFWLPLFATAVIFETQLRGLAIGLGKYKARMIATILENTFFLGGVAGAALTGYLTADFLIPLYLSGCVISVAFLLVVVARAAEGPPAWNSKLIPPMFSYSLGASLYRGSNYLSFRVDIFLLAAFLDTHALGIYSLATSIIEAISQLPKGISDAIVTHTAQTEPVELKGEKIRPFLMVYHLVTFYTLVACIATAIASPWAVPLLFSNKFAPSVSILMILIPGAFGLMLGRIAAHHLMGLGETRLPWIANFGCVGLLITLDLVLIPRWGISGAAVAFSGSYLLMTVILLWSVAGRLNISPFRLVAPSRDDLTLLVNRFKSVWFQMFSHAF